MSKQIICPECGSPVEEGKQFCDDCGADILQQADSPKAVAQKPQPVVEKPKVPSVPSAQEGDGMIGDGARVNVGGSINKSSTTNANIQTSNTVNSTRTSNVSTSNIDNSSTVHNNTTIVMSGEKAEYCEVCGDPLGEKHARCPKCGKSICFDCKVKGKNRCVECEKKYVNEYRLAFQQLLLTTDGDIGVAGRQMMDQKARELDVEDVKAKIEDECMAFYKPKKSQQPAAAGHKQVAVPQAQAPVNSTPASSAPASSGPADKRIEVPPTLVGSQGGQKPVGGKSKGRSSVGMIVGIVALAVVAVVLLKVLGKNDSAEEVPAVGQTVNEAPVAKPAAPAPASAPAASAPAAAPAPKPAAKPAPAPKPAVDADYEAGMAAYKNGNGLEAVSAFTKSGSAESHYMLGVIYKDGCGSVGKNEMKAHKSFKKAASMGHEGAKAQL